MSIKPFDVFGALSILITIYLYKSNSLCFYNQKDGFMKNFKILALALSLYAGHAVCSDAASNEKQSSSVLQKVDVVAQKTFGATQVAVGTGAGLVALGMGLSNGLDGWQGYRSELGSYKGKQKFYEKELSALRRSKGGVRMALMKFGLTGALFAGMLSGCAYVVHNGISRFRNNTFDTAKEACA